MSSVTVKLWQNVDIHAAKPFTIYINSNCVSVWLIFVGTGCREDGFQCNDGPCIDISKYCNFMLDCPSGDDEENCGIYYIHMFGRLVSVGKDKNQRINNIL